MNNSTPLASAGSLEARVAARMVAGLNERSAALPHDITERLRVARESAVARAVALARQQRSATAPVVVGRSGGAATLGAPSPWWMKAASVLPLLVLLAGLIGIQYWDLYEQVQAAADIDAALLTDDLPPQAFSDPGFAEYLKSAGRSEE